MSDLYDLEKLNKLALDQQIKIKKYIIKNNELRTIPKEYLPSIVTDEYYFISYSHLDYKEVYSDLFDLERAGLAIWYDLGMPAGSNWKDTATKFLMPYQCKGVLFYLSRNALKSQAIVNEIEFAERAKKPIVAIFLGESPEDKLWDLIDELFENKEINQYAYQLFERVFNKDILYLTTFESASRRKDQIKTSLPKIQKLEIDFSRLDEHPENIADLYPNVILTIKSLNDYYANKIVAKDYESLLTDERLIKKVRHMLEESGYDDLFDEDQELCCDEYIIGAGAFSNMINLEYVEIPSNPDEGIGSCAFSGCTNLKTVKFLDYGDVALGDCVFYNCESLEEFNFDNVYLGNACFVFCHNLKKVDLSKLENENIPMGSFQYCLSLKEVIFKDDIKVIETKAFSFTGVEEIELPKSLEKIEWAAFYDCKKLRKVIFNEGLKEMESDAFGRCPLLEEVHLPSSLEKAEYCFNDCYNLKRIYYNGTIAQFNKLTDDDPTKIIGLIDFEKPPVEHINHKRWI